MRAWKRMAMSLLILGLLTIPMGLVEHAAAAQQEKSGAQLWSENCGRCHNLRSPKERSDRQWEIIVFHMRTRANLIGQEAEKILEFLKKSN